MTTLSAGWTTTELFLLQPLNPLDRPSDKDEHILYGDGKTSQHMQDVIDAAANLTVCHSVTRENRHNVLTAVSVLSVSAAKYERGFGATDHILTDGRNRMHISMLSSLLLISLNGPGVSSFPAGDFQRCG